MTAPISPKWLEGRVIENRRWTERLFSLRVEAPRLRFEAGQFVRIALEERIARPFSFVNTPEDPVLEFYGIVVPEGPLSPKLAHLRAELRELGYRTGVREGESGWFAKSGAELDIAVRPFGVFEPR